MTVVTTAAELVRGMRNLNEMKAQIRNVTNLMRVAVADTVQRWKNSGDKSYRVIIPIPNSSLKWIIGQTHNDELWEEGVDISCFANDMGFIFGTVKNTCISAESMRASHVELVFNGLDALIAGVKEHFPEDEVNSALTPFIRAAKKQL